MQGACDMGGLPNVYTGYQRVDDRSVQEKFEKAWRVPLSAKPGLTLTEMMKAIGEGKIKALFILGENPLLTDPNGNKIKEELKHLEFLAVQDIFMTETAELAHVVLPGVSFAEKDGTFTNTERRVQRVRKAINPLATRGPIGRSSVISPRDWAIPWSMRLPPTSWRRSRRSRRLTAASPTIA